MIETIKIEEKKVINLLKRQKGVKVDSPFGITVDFYWANKFVKRGVLYFHFRNHWLVCRNEILRNVGEKEIRKEEFDPIKMGLTRKTPDGLEYYESGGYSYPNGNWVAEIIPVVDNVEELKNFFN